MDTPVPALLAVVLAAGEGRRLGGPKVGARLGGRPFVAWVLAALRAARVGEILVVLRALPPPPEAAPYLEDVATAVTPDPQAGPIGSLRVGVAAAAARGARGLLVHPVDHPLVRPATLVRLAAGFPAPGELVRVPVHAGRRGHPVVFARELFPALQAVPRGEGARWVVRRAGRGVREVVVPDPGVLLNVDDPSDLARAERLCRREDPGAGPAAASRRT